MTSPARPTPKSCMFVNCVLLSLLCCNILTAGGEVAAASQTAGEELLAAARAGDTDRVVALLEVDSSLVNVRDGDGMTSLHLAVQAGHVVLAEQLLDSGADISAVDAQSRTPLHHAASEGDTLLVALLLARGADVMAREFRGRTPLFIAVNWGGSLEAVELLLAAGADVNDRTERGEEILFSTLYYGDPETIRVLLEAGARLPEDDDSIRQAVYLAASNGFEQVFEMAVAEAGSRGLSWWENVPMQAAARGGSVTIGEALRANGQSVDEKDLYGITPLHVAAENGHLAFVEFLVGEGASVEEASAMGLTAKHFASEMGHLELAARLRAMGASAAPPVFPPLEGPWLGQPEPEESPERFAPGIVSGHGFDSEHSPAAFSPDGTEVYWTQKFRGPVLFSRLGGDGWTMPRPATFNTEHGEGEPIFSPDGQRLYFLSMRPLGPGAEAGKENIWFVEREGERWSDPHPVDTAVNEYDLHWLVSISEAGTLYFASIHDGGLGGHDIYRSRRAGGVQRAPENLGSVINTEGSDHTPFIAPDESYIIFASTGHGADDGMFHFFVSYQGAAGRWLPPQRLDHIVTPVESPLCPMVTADGEFLFFIGSGDIWWTRADFIEQMRPQAVPQALSDPPPSTRLAQNTVNFPVAARVLVDGVFERCEGIAFNGEGDLYVAGNGALWRVSTMGEANQIADLYSNLGLAPIGERDILMADFGPTNRFNQGPNTDGIVWRITPEGEKTRIVDGGLGDPNAIWVRPDGYFLVSDDATDEIFIADMDGRVGLFTDVVGHPNGIAISADGSRLYVAQIFKSLRPLLPDGRLWSVPLEDGLPSGPAELIVDLGDAAANDGLALDELGRIYVAANGAGQIWRVDPETLETVLIAENMPGVASLAFGKGDFDPHAIYATSTRTGKVWEVKVGIGGAPLHH